MYALISLVPIRCNVALVILTSTCFCCFNSGN